jgi:hypothetical protein
MIPILSVSFLLSPTRSSSGTIRNSQARWVWWYMPIIPALGRLRQEGGRVEREKREKKGKEGGKKGRKEGRRTNLMDQLTHLRF